jgi:tetratricopeptide (TPR) repeat protein
MKTALDYYQSAVDLDPSFARAYSGKAVLHSIMANAPWIANECDHQGQAELSIETALRLDPLDQQSHVAFAYDAARRGAIGEARSGYHRAIELSPSGVMAPTLLGRIEALRGEADRSRLMLDRLRLLSPMEAEDEYNYGSELLNRLSAGENEQAGEIARMLENRQTEMPHTLALVVAGLAHGGDNELAKTSATRLLTVAPRFTSDGFVNSLPVLTQEMADLLKAGLNKAGVH